MVSTPPTMQSPSLTLPEDDPHGQEVRISNWVSLIKQRLANVSPLNYDASPRTVQTRQRLGELLFDLHDEACRLFNLPDADDDTYDNSNRGEGSSSHHNILSHKNNRSNGGTSHDTLISTNGVGSPCGDKDDSGGVDIPLDAEDGGGDETASDPADPPQQPPLSKDDLKAGIVRERVDSIIDSFHAGGVTQQEVLQLISPTPTRRRPTHATAEDAALRLLCRGYDSVVQTPWSQPCEHLAVPVPTMVAFYKKSALFDSMNDDLGLLNRHQWTAEIGNAYQTNAWVGLVLKHVETLKFAVLWAAIAGKGSTKFKRTFLEDAFCAQAHIAQELHKRNILPRDLKNSQEKVITARNRLLMLYNYFGSGVLIDEIWNVDGPVQRRSHVFSNVLQSLINRVSALPDPPGTQATIATTLTSRHIAGRQALCALVKALAGREVSQYVEEFLLEYPPSLAGFGIAV